MAEPHVHFAYAPRGAGLLCALFWFVSDDHVYGWFTGAKAHEHPAAFFMLEHYYSARQTVCYRSLEDEVLREGEMRPDDPRRLPVGG